jgi:beta-glucanase (GH16 family)
VFRYFLFLTILCNASVQPATIGGWQFIWSDEFSRAGSPISPDWNWTNWKSTVRDARFSERHAWCEDGKLIIEATRDTDGGYTSSAISGLDKKYWLYGRFEMRAKIDIQPGSWPAWWTGNKVGAWPDGGEIDMMESYENKSLFNVMDGNKKWDSKTVQYSTLGDRRWADHFHVWTFEWSMDSIKLSLDDLLMNDYPVKSANGTSNQGDGNPFHTEHFFILNLAIGGNPLWLPTNSTFPIRLEVDYVRGYTWVNKTAYTVKVNNGAGNGSYVPGTPVSIVANMPKSGMKFGYWKPESGSPQIQEIANGATRITAMPSADVTVTAVYVDSTNVETLFPKQPAAITDRVLANIKCLSRSRLALSLNRGGVYSIALFSPNGRMVRTIAGNRYLSAGTHTFDWNGASPSDGLYVVKVNGLFGKNQQSFATYLNYGK